MGSVSRNSPAVGGQTVGDDGPGARRGDGEGEAGLDVGLVKAGERHAGVHGDEEGIDVLGVVVAVEVADEGAAGRGDRAFEGGDDGVLSGAQDLGRDFDVAARDPRRELGAVDREAEQLALAVVEQERGLAGQCEGEARAAGHVRSARREGEAEAVAEVGYECGAFAGERARDAFGRCGGHSGGEEQGGEDGAQHCWISIRRGGAETRRKRGEHKFKT